MHYSEHSEPTLFQGIFFFLFLLHKRTLNYLVDEHVYLVVHNLAMSGLFFFLYFVVNGVTQGCQCEFIDSASDDFYKWWEGG